MEGGGGRGDVTGGVTERGQGTGEWGVRGGGGVQGGSDR